MTGLDQIPFCGERSALLQVCLAAAQAATPVSLLIDNKAVLDRLTRGITCGDWSGDLLPFWTQIGHLWVPGSRFLWVPAHGKRPTWDPPAHWPSATICRALNAAADAGAAAALEPFRADHAARRTEQLTAHRWAVTAFQRQRLVTTPFWQAWCDHWHQ